MCIVEFSALIPILCIYKNHPEDIGEIKDGYSWQPGFLLVSTWHELCEGGVMDYALWLRKKGI